MLHADVGCAIGGHVAFDARSLPIANLAAFRITRFADGHGHIRRLSGIACIQRAIIEVIPNIGVVEFFDDLALSVANPPLAIAWCLGLYRSTSRFVIDAATVLQTRARLALRIGARTHFCRLARMNITSACGIHPAGFRSAG